MSFTLAIVGRPNVGKSTLFNRLAGKKLAIVHDTPGVTRDWRVAEASLPGLSFHVMDTAGLEDSFGEDMFGRMRARTEHGLGHADAVLFLIDARAGLTPLDRHFAAWLRKQDIPVILAGNKCESTSGDVGLVEAWELGLGTPIPLSAEHGLGMSDLADAVAPLIRRALPESDAPPGEIIQMAIVGRPNVGKSTLLNALVEDDRVMTGPEPGVTRDAVHVDWHWRDHHFRLVDTAGMRRKARIDDTIEKLSVAATLTAVRLAQVVVLVLDADAVLDKQDLQIASHVVEEGRCLIIAINKWDAAADRQLSLGRLNDRLQTSLPQVRGVPTVTISALKRQGLDKLLQAVIDTYGTWNSRVSTGRLNRWLEGMTQGHPPPMSHGRPNRIRYVSQIKNRPPTFAAWMSRPKDLPDSYVRYLVNGLRDAFALDGVPIRLHLRSGKNPYVEDGA